MLDVNDLVEGVTKVKVLSLPHFVLQKVGDVGTFSKKGNKYNSNIIGVTFGDIQVGGGDEGPPQGLGQPRSLLPCRHQPARPGEPAARPRCQ